MVCKRGFNLYHSMGKFSRQQIDHTFLSFPRKQNLTFLCKLSLLEMSNSVFWDRDSLHEMLNSLFWEKLEKYLMSSAGHLHRLIRAFPTCLIL